MASGSSEVDASGSSSIRPVADSTEDEASKSGSLEEVATSRHSKKQRRISFLGRIWKVFSLFGSLFYSRSNEDFEKRLQHLSKEEAAAHSRLKRRSQTWRRLARGLIIYSVALELLLLGVAVVMTRAPELSWQTRAVRVLPVFAFPALASLVYSSCSRYYRMCERKDEKLLDRLRNERKAKIDELKERTNYYLTQQLIHKYDSDPAAKEAAARVLASKLGADAGLSLSLEQSNMIKEIGRGSFEAQRSNAEFSDVTGLRRRGRPQGSQAAGQLSINPGQIINDGGFTYDGGDSVGQIAELEQAQGRMSSGIGGGWLARLAAMLVGEDPTQCYALICKNCHMHNGLARKEDFQYIAYYCRHCHCLNQSRQLEENVGDVSTPLVTTPRAEDVQIFQNAVSLITNASEIVGTDISTSEKYVTTSEQSSSIGS